MWIVVVTRTRWETVCAEPCLHGSLGIFLRVRRTLLTSIAQAGVVPLEQDR